MRLSESLRKNIMHTAPGGIINRFKILSRRDVLFFDDIFIPYIGMCEKSDNGESVKEVGREWMNLYFSILLPSELRKIPPATFFNLFMRKVWSNLGLLDDLKARAEGDCIRLMTKNEKITLTIGKNSFLPSLYMGALDVLCGSKVELGSSLQTKKKGGWNLYSFRITKEPAVFYGKTKHVYNRINRFGDGRGFTLKDAVKSDILQIKGDNRIYFREKQLSAVENTLFHLLGKRNLLMDGLAKLSFNLFKNTIKGDSSVEQKLNLLKTLLLSMGWGQSKIALDKKTITISMLYPPIGLQSGEDDWRFLAHSVLGYMLLINRDSRISSMDYHAVKSCLNIYYEF